MRTLSLMHQLCHRTLSLLRRWRLLLSSLSLRGLCLGLRLSLSLRLRLGLLL